MLISLNVLQILTEKIKPLRVLHVGAHLAEEAESYKALGAETVCWVESQPELIPHLETKLDKNIHQVFQGTAWSKTGEEKTFHLASNLQSSSVYPFHLHMQSHPEVHQTARRPVTTVRLDDLVPNYQFDMVAMDIQGAELEALKGMGRLLKNVRVAYLEVNNRELYKGMPMVEELDLWLSAEGFKRLLTSWEGKKGWGDAVYVRRIGWLRQLRALVEFRSSKTRRSR